MARKIVLSPPGAKAGVSIEELVARRTLPPSLSIRPVLDAAGQETGNHEVPAGGRRYPARSSTW